MNVRLYKGIQIAGLVFVCAGLLAIKADIEVAGVTAISVGCMAFLCGLLGKWFNDT